VLASCFEPGINQQRRSETRAREEANSSARDSDLRDRWRIAVIVVGERVKTDRMMLSRPACKLYRIESLQGREATLLINGEQQTRISVRNARKLEHRTGLEQ
jgi:hypothetical protein